MQRRSAIAGAVMLVTVGAAAAVTIPAMADEEPARNKRPATAAGAAEPEMIDALRRDLRLTADQAQQRLRKEEWARQTARQLRADLGGGFGGTWITADGRQLVVAVTDRAAAEKVRATGAEPRMVTRSERQLVTAKQSLDRNATEATRNIPGWYIDVKNNSVVVLAKPGTEAKAMRFATASGVPAESVRVDTSSESPRLLFDVRGGDPYFINGNARCSIGFSVEGGFVTAGHCGQEGSNTTGFNQAAQGTFSVSSFPGDDLGVVEVNGDWDPRPVVNDFNGGEVEVAGSEEAPVGASVCRSGSTTGTRCGVIQAKNVTVNYPEGTVTGLTQTNVCAEGGDSGGSWMSGDQAQGVTSGGSGNCTAGGTTFFQPLTEILEENNLTLVTTASGNGDAGNGNGDAGNGDAGDGDAGNGDAGNGEAGDGDAGNGEAGNGDAGNGGAGNGDAGNGDAGNGDAGDAGAGHGDADAGNGDGDAGAGDGDAGAGEGDADAGNGDAGGHGSGRGTY